MGTIDFEQIAPVLKRAARERGLTYRALGKALGVSESAIKKTLNGADCSINRLSRLCEVLDLSLEEVVAAATRPAVESTELTLAQQRFLVSNRDALLVYWKLSADGASIARITKETGMPRARVHALLHGLDRQGLIRFDGRRAVAPSLEHVVWGGDGPLIALVRETFSANVLRAAVDGADRRGHRVSLRSVRLTAAGVEEANVAITELLTAIERRAGLERRLASRGAKPFSVLVATALASPLE